MIKKRVMREAGLSEAACEWNTFIDIIAMEEYADLAPVQRVPHLAFWYDSEVQNGGHIQYFENQGTRLLQPTLDALTAMGAHGQRDVLTRAGARFLEKPRKRLETVDEFVAASLAGEFDDCDTAYHKCRPDMEALLAKYLKAHRESFIDE